MIGYIEKPEDEDRFKPHDASDNKVVIWVEDHFEEIEVEY